MTADIVLSTAHGCAVTPRTLSGCSRRYGPPVCSIREHGMGLRCTRIHTFRAAAIFYPNFYPNRQRGGIEMSYLLVKAAN
jgi:hypothetical protein